MNWQKLAISLGVVSTMLPGPARVGHGIAQIDAAAIAAETPVNPRISLQEGHSIFRTACAPCHGSRGDGRGPAAANMDPRPRDFTTGVFKFRQTPSGALPTDLDLFRSVSRGVPGTWMPAWEETLSERQRWAVIAYLKTLIPDSGSGFAGDSPIALSSEPPTATTADEGRFVYVLLGCAKCHGTSGRGDGPSAGTLTDDWERSIQPYDFTRGDYKNGRRPEDLYRTLRTGLNGTPMPSYEIEAVLFTADEWRHDSSQEGIIGEDELAALSDYVSRQPTRSDVEAMSRLEREDLAEHRLWSVVAYLKSLERAPGVWYRLFVEDPSATRSRPE
jgi:mono/diheme cytochrome c family protein